MVFAPEDVDAFPRDGGVRRSRGQVSSQDPLSPLDSWSPWRDNLGVLPLTPAGGPHQGLLKRRVSR